MADPVQEWIDREREHVANEPLFIRQDARAVYLDAIERLVALIPLNITHDVVEFEPGVGMASYRPETDAERAARIIAALEGTR